MNRIEHYRKIKLGLTQQQLAKKLGVSVGTIYIWEKKEVDSIKKIMSIMESLEKLYIENTKNNF